MRHAIALLLWVFAIPVWAASSTVTINSTNPVSGLTIVTVTQVTNASVTADPASVTVLTNSDVEFSATASGNLLSYYWITNGALAVDGSTLAGATTTSLTLSNVVIGQSNMPVAFIVSNYCTIVTSAVAVLTVTNGSGDICAGVTSDPSNVTALTNSDVQFTAAASGTSPSYYWITNGALAANGDDIAGATTTTLIISNIVIGMSNMPVAFIASNSCGSVTSAVAVLTVTNSPGGGGVNNAGLSNYWKFDETMPFTSGLADSVGAATVWTNSDNGTGFNSSAGVLGNCTTFTASHTCYATTNKAIILGNNAWTITGWANFTTLQALGAIITKDAGSAREVMIREESSDNKLHFYVSTTSDTWDKSVVGGATLSTATWYFFAAVHDPSGGGSITLYIANQSSMLSTNTTASIGTVYTPAAGGIYFGDHFGSGNDLDAKLDEIGIWKKAMTAAEVSAEWNNGTGITHP